VAGQDPHSIDHQNRCYVLATTHAAPRRPGTTSGPRARRFAVRGRITTPALQQRYAPMIRCERHWLLARSLALDGIDDSQPQWLKQWHAAANPLPFHAQSPAPARRGPAACDGAHRAGDITPAAPPLGNMWPHPAIAWPSTAIAPATNISYADAADANVCGAWGTQLRCPAGTARQSLQDVGHRGSLLSIEP
jgi:hypothetical protein